MSVCSILYTFSSLDIWNYLCQNVFRSYANPIQMQVYSRYASNKIKLSSLLIRSLASVSTHRHLLIVKPNRTSRNNPFLKCIIIPRLNTTRLVILLMSTSRKTYITQRHRRPVFRSTDTRRSGYVWRICPAPDKTPADSDYTARQRSAQAA